MLPTVSVEARLVADPELAFTPQGVAKCRLRLVASDRVKDGEKWTDNPDRQLWINATCWRETAENVAESLTKGDLVLVSGKLRTNSWEDREGNKRSTIEIIDAEVGASLHFRSFPHRAAQQQDGGSQPRQGQPAQGQTQRSRGRQDPNNDPWATPGGGYTEPPF